MRGRRFAALVILVVQMLLLCTACRAAEDAMNASTDAAAVSGAEDGTGEENRESVDQLDANESSAEPVVQERYEAVPVELFALRFVGKASEDIAWQKAQVITSYTELEAFRRQLAGLWTGAESEKCIEQFRGIADSYHEESFEKKALIGLFVQQDNWDYEYAVELVRDNELRKLELKVTAARPEEVDYQRESAWLLLMEVDSTVVKDITDTTVTVDHIVDADRAVIWSDVVTIPGGGLDSSEPVMIESPEELQALIEASGVADTIDWKVLMRNYLNAPSRQEENVIFAVSASAPGNTTEYDARAVLNKNNGELILDVFYCMREDAVVFGNESRLIFIEIKRSDLEKAKEIRQDAIGISYDQEDLIAWGIPYGVDDEHLTMQEADLDHDGEKEQINLYYSVENVAYGNKQGRVSLVVFENGKQLWSDVLSINIPSKDKNAKTYYLCHREGKDYLLFCNENRYEYDEYGNWFELYSFTEEGFLEREDRDSIWIRFDQYRMEHFPVSANELEKYAEHINGLLANCVYICRVENGTASWAPPKATRGEEPYYEEDFDLLFLGETADAGGKTLGEKTAIFNQTLLNGWFADGQIPEMPEDFKTLMGELIAEKRSVMNVFTQLAEADRSVWFEDYNGEKLQIVEPEYESTSPASYPGKVYYRADEGETPEEAAKKMVEAMVQHMMEDSQGQEFVITKYRITEQSLTSWEDIVASYTTYCWEDYLAVTGGLDDSLLSYAETWVEQSFQYGKMEIPLGDDMWYFYPAGYYHFEGFYLGTFEDYAQMGTVVDGMVRFYYQGGNPQFILVKYGDVYCMQKGIYWGSNGRYYKPITSITENLQ